VAIRITVWIQELFSGFVAIGRYGKWLTDVNVLLILIRQMAALVKTRLGRGMHCPSASSLNEVVIFNRKLPLKVYTTYGCHL